MAQYLNIETLISLERVKFYTCAIFSDLDGPRECHLHQCTFASFSEMHFAYKCAIIVIIVAAPE